MNAWIIATALLIAGCPVQAQQRTCCNPVDIDYGYCPIPDFTRQGCHRTTADPVIVNFKGMDQRKSYFFAIEAINGNGISTRVNTCAE